MISLIISEFECIHAQANAGVSGIVDVRLCGRPEVFLKLDTALTATVKQLEIQEEYFGIKYPLAKCGILQFLDLLIFFFIL